MVSFTLGSDVYLEFVVKVNRKPAMVVSTTGSLYRKNGEYLREFTTRHVGGKVSGAIDGKTFSTVGEFKAEFDVFIAGMGKREHAIPFTITPSVLGKKRQERE